jgi:non-heme chloroperoxidase
MPLLTLRDNAQLYYKDWGNKNGPAVFLSHGWPLNADNWESQMFFLANKGYRCVAHDRRGHGRSDQTWEGNDVDTWADDIAEVIEYLDLKGLTMIGHSTGGSDIVRYIARRKSSSPGLTLAALLIAI